MQHVYQVVQVVQVVPGAVQVVPGAVQVVPGASKWPFWSFWRKSRILVKVAILVILALKRAGCTRAVPGR